jgi:hypothetical protein
MSKTWFIQCGVQPEKTIQASRLVALSSSLSIPGSELSTMRQPERPLLPPWLNS